MENSNWQFVLLFGHENLVLITIHPRLAAKKLFVIVFCKFGGRNVLLFLVVNQTLLNHQKL